MRSLYAVERTRVGVEPQPCDGRVGRRSQPRAPGCDEPHATRWRSRRVTYARSRDNCNPLTIPLRCSIVVPVSGGDTWLWPCGHVLVVVVNTSMPQPLTRFNKDAKTGRLMSRPVFYISTKLSVALRSGIQGRSTCLFLSITRQVALCHL